MSLRTLTIVALSVFMVFVIGVSALQVPVQTNGNQTGGRNAGVKPKRTTQRRNPREGKSKALTASSILSSPLATADFDLLGLAVTADPASLTVPKNTATSIHTSVRVPEGTDPLNIIAALNPNYRVRGELTGPSLTAPLTLEAPIGQPLNIPALSNAGDHLVRNLRVVDVSTPEQTVVTSVTPDSVGIVVIERLLVSQVQVNELNYDQIVQAGINITGDSYRAFNFTLAVATTSNVETIAIPVAFPPVGVQDPRPIIGIPTVSSPGVDVPFVAPVMLQVGEGDDGPPAGLPVLPGEGPVQIPGVIVFPGRVGFLHQFFEAIVIVSNGAPNGTPLVLHSLHAKAHLPDAGTPADALDDPLRIAETQVGGRVSELDLHGLGADNKYGTGDDVLSFGPSEAGQATFLLEGLKEGLHEISFDLEAMLEGLPSGPVKVSGSVTGAVLVRDASFAVTFTHPNVVRAGNEYDLGMTVYNSGQTDIQGAFAQLPPTSISGAEFVGQDTGQRQFATTIKRGESATVKWRLRANVTGEVTASYVKVGEGISAGLALVTGVGDRNIPLSPDSLILPEPVKHLPPNVVENARALLGQAWSIANAPAGSLPQGVRSLSKQAVVNRAVELGIAGMRVDFGEPVMVSLDTVLRDWLGELQNDAGFADAQRNTRSGYEWFDSVGSEIYDRLNTGTSPSTPLAFHQEFANTELSRSRFISALVTHASGPAIAGTRFIDAQGKQAGFGTTSDERNGDFAQGSSLRLFHKDVISGAITNGGQMLVVSNPVANNWTLELNGWLPGSVDLSLVAPATSEAYNLYSWTGIEITQGGKYRVRFKPLSLSSVPVLEEFRDGSWQAMSAIATVTPLAQSAPRVVGVIQVTPDVVAGGDKYGRLVGILFSKPMLVDQAQTISRYRIGGGMLKGSNPAQEVGGPISVTGAKIDYGNRFVFLSLNSTIGPYIERDLTISSMQDTRRLSLSPSPVTTIIEPRVSPEGKPPGAYLTGRVINADGTPVPNAPVIYWIQECPDPTKLLPEEPKPIVLKNTDAQGRYVIDYVRDSDCNPLSVTVNNPTTHSEKRLTSPVAYDGQHMVLDMVFLARGSVEGDITSGGQPMPKAFVRIVPDLDVIGTKVVQADQNGHYVATDIPVGNVSVLAVGDGVFHNASGFNAGTINGPNQTAFINVSLQNIAGVVRGRVFRSDLTASPGALVVAYAVIPGFRSLRTDGATAVGYAFADRDGNFTIANLPIGDIKLEVTDYVTNLFTQQNVQLSSAIPEVNGLVIVLPGTGSVTGRVTDDVGTPLANVFVSSAGRAVQTDSLGNYTLQSLPAGMKSIAAFDPATQRAGSALAQVTIGQTTTGVDIVILRPSSIEGTVYLVKEGTSTALPDPGVGVSIDGNTIVNTNAQGHYSIANVPPGDYILRVIDGTKAYAINTPIKLLPGETLTRDATFRPATIHGKVFQPDGVTPTIAQLSVYVPHALLTAGPGWGLISTEPPLSTQSAADGSYSLTGLNPGTFRITTSNVFFPTRVSVGGTLPPGGNEEVNLSLVSTLAGKIQGNVFRPDGTTSVGPSIRVTLSGGSLADATVLTDENGHYEFGEVFSAGTYNLTATDPASGQTNRITVSVERNKDAVFDLRLLGLGNLRVQVLDGAGQPASGGTVTIDGTTYPNAHRFANVVDSNGQITFNNLPEGSYAISATRFGLGGRANANVVINSTVDVSVQLQATGNVEGHVYLPDGTTAISLADVQLRVGGRSIGFTVTSEAPDIGKFSFVNVPTGDFTLDAFDNHTGRVGRAAGSVTTQAETVVVNVLLLPVGAVSGQVTANGIGVDHALVHITADGSGVRGADLLATTDPTGHYRFTGIPAGRFVINVSDAPGGQTGSASGTISGTVEPLPDTIVNIALEPSQTVRGTVYRFGGTEPLPGAKVTITVAGRVFQTATNDQGAYALAFIPLGTVTVRAEAPVGYDRGEAAPVTGTQIGGTITVNVTMNGVGTVSGTALDSNGTPLNSGTVVFTNSVWSPAVILNASVQSNGTFEFTGVPAGTFSLRLTVPGRVAVGSASGNALAAQTTNINLQLEDAGTVTGKVYATDGSTPVQGASVSVTLTRPSGVVSFFAHSGAGGIWTLNNVPLGTLEIKITDEVSGGVARAKNVVLATNGQIVDLGTMLLDSTPISVVSVQPANGTLSVPTNNTVVTITFSEPAEASTVNSSTVQLQLNNSGINVTRSLSSDGRVVTLTPTSKLAESSVYKVFVNNVEDLAGIRIASAFSSTFTTADETAPVVNTTSPTGGATAVSTSTNIVVTFNEPIDSNDNLANIIKITQSTNPPLAGSYALSTDGRVATFTPAVALADSTTYTINVNGQRDAAGNTQTQALAHNFTTVDLTAPIVDPLPIDGTTVHDFTPTIIATYHDNLSGIKTSTVVFTLDNVNVTQSASVTGSQLTFTPSTPLTGGIHTVTVQVADNAGNLSALRTASFTVDDSGPDITSFTIGGAPAVDGMFVTSSLQPVFAVAYTDDTGIKVSATKLLFAPQGSPLVVVPATISQTGLTYQPPAFLAEGQYAVQAIITNNLGTSSTTGVINFTLDVDAPEITSVTPSTGNQHGGTTVTITGARLLNTAGTAPTITIGNNPTIVTSFVAGSPDVITIITPAGVAGPATIRISTDRGTGVAVNGFTYQADPRTPFITEPDTVLLWHMDELANGAIRIVDSGITRSLYGTASSTSLAQPGRFFLGRSDAGIFSDTSSSLHFPTTSFTVEGWVKTGVVPRTYTLFGHEDSTGGQTNFPSYTVRLSPNGNLRGLAQDSAGRQWVTDVPSSVYKVDDNQWHQIALVVNRTISRMSLYVDGIERAFSAPPTGLTTLVSSTQVLRVGQRGFDAATPNGPIAFPGIIDEVRVSSTAHSSDQIQKTYLGTEGTLGITIANTSPPNLARGTTTEVQLNGYNLAGTIASITGPASAQVTAQVLSSSATQARVQITVASDAPLGDGQLVISSSAGLASLPFRIIELSKISLVVESDTRLLWHLNETGNGAVTIFDAGPLRLHGTAGSLSAAEPGRFDGGRRRAFIAGTSGITEIYSPTSSFTVEGWVKTDPVGRTYNLFGKQDQLGGQFSLPEFCVRLYPSGTLRAFVSDSGSRQWLADLPNTLYRVDDNQWHYVAMVVDRTVNRLSLYVDGIERVSSAPPVGFTNPTNTSNAFRAGHWAFFDLQTTGGAQEFPGLLDEIRVSVTAHTAQRILDDMIGSSPLRVTSYDPKEVLREKDGLPSTITPITLNGYNLDGVTARLMRDGQVVDAVVSVDSSSPRQAIVSVDALATAPLGIAQLVLSKPGQADVAVDLRISQQAELAAALDTLLLWNLNETGDGAVRVFDANALGIHGTADAQSLEKPGRFGRGRANANIFSDPDKDALYVGSSSFTVECWFKTNPVSRAYTLVGKEDSFGGQFVSPDFTIRLSPTGALRAYAFDTSQRLWRVDMPALVYPVDDNQWHHVALVLDRSITRLSLYVDGIERAASGTPPANFAPLLLKTSNPLRAGHWAFFEESSGGGPEEFPGTIDDVRFSNTAHSAARIRADLDGVPGLRINSYGPREIARNPSTGPQQFTTVTATGFGLDNVTASVMRDGQLLDATVIVDSSSYNQAQLRVSVAATVTPGLAQLVYAKPGLPVVPVEIRIREQSEFATDVDTRLLWHLNETGNGAVHVFDAGPLGIGGSADAQSVSESGHFGQARRNANVASDPDFEGLYLGSSSFTVECWMKTGPVTRAYTLVGKEDSFGGQFVSPEFALRLSPTGGLRAYVFDTSQRLWRADMTGRVYDPVTGRWSLMVDDNEWHHVAMVVDRSIPKLTLYVDGIERASGTPPANFVQVLLKTSNPVRAGHWAFFEESTGGGPEEFPGLIDEVRISTTAHSAARIFTDAVGTDVAHLSSMQPFSVPKGSFSVPVTFTGFGLAGATVTTDQPNVTLTVTSTTPTNINALMDVPVTANIGPLNFNITTTSGQIFTTSLTILDHQPFSNPPNSGTETVVLWHLDETGNGAVHIDGAGDPVPTVIGGTASSISTSVDGRFGKGRANANIVAETANNSTHIDTGNFTVECWFKGGPSVTRAYTLVGKEDSFGGQFVSAEYSLRLTPTGGLRAYVFDPSQRLWKAEMAGHVFDPVNARYLPTMNDGQWHYVAMVADRGTGKLTIYADGVERASGTPPANYVSTLLNTSNPLRVGHWAFFEDSSGGGPEAFPGVIDEVRILNFARTAAQIADTWYGTNGGAQSMTAAAKTSDEKISAAPRPALIVNTITPSLIARDRASQRPVVNGLAIAGANLSGVTARVLRDGQPLDSVAARVKGTTDSQAQLDLAVSPNTPLGPAQLVLSRQGYSDVAVDIRVIEPGEFALEADTVGLWHLDEREKGMAHLLDAGANAINLTSANASRSANGRFGAGRTLARATADASNSALAFGTSSFTVEGWVKAPALGRDYVLIGKETNNGQNTDYSLKALASGALRAEIYDTGGLVWQAETLAGAGTLTDDQWHAVAMVVDRETGWLSLYIDSQLRMMQPAPVGFGAVRNLGQPLQFGTMDSDSPAGNGSEEFPGVLDEIRISASLHTAEKIAADFFGYDEPKITLVRPPVIRKGAGAIEVTLSGYGLIGATVVPNQPGVTATVISSTSTSIRISLAVSDSVSPGPMPLLFKDVLGRGFNAEFIIEERPAGGRVGFSGGPPDIPPNRLKPPRGLFRSSRLNQHAKQVGGQR